MKRYEEIKIEYLRYLMTRVQIDEAGENGYYRLCLTMMTYNFLPIIYMDENRCYECQQLRKDYADMLYDPECADILDSLCGEYGTLLELFVVMAEKMQYELMDSQYEAGINNWFMEILQNCGLADSRNSSFEREGYDEYVVDILDKINYRKYGWDGEGGLFPLRWPKQDQRYTELIVQMNSYIEENYDIC